MTERKRAILYGRVSSGKDRLSTPVDDQLAALRAWAQHADVEVVAERRDDGISASRYARGKVRPEWQLVLDDLAAGGVDMLAVWELSRSTRDRAMWATLFAALIDANAVLVVDGRIHDPADPDDGFILDLDHARGVHESAKTSKRTIRGAASRAQAGRPHGTTHYGLRIEYDPATGKPTRRVLDDAQAAIVREAAQRILSGETPTGVARDLDRRGVPTATGGGQWRGNNLLRLVCRPSMAGLVVHRGRVLDDVSATWPAILTVDEHRRLCAIRDDPMRRSLRSGSHTKYLLTGIARCGVCGGPVRILPRQRQHGRVMAYDCRDGYCVARLADELDQAVSRLAVARISRDDFRAALAASANDPATEAAADEVARLRRKLDEARGLANADRLSLESLASIEADTLPRLRAAEKRARPRHVPQVVLDLAEAEDVAARWAATQITARRAIVRALMTVEIGRSARRGPGTSLDLDSIKVTWKV